MRDGVRVITGTVKLLEVIIGTVKLLEVIIGTVKLLFIPDCLKLLNSLTNNDTHVT